MVTTSRRFALIIRSRAAASPFLIFRASSISCCRVKRGMDPISRRYLLSTVSLSFIDVSYVRVGGRGYCERVGFADATRGVIAAPSFGSSTLSAATDLSSSRIQGHLLGNLFRT